jgi:Photoprotection regulator fluorescence recovery protein
MSSFQSLGDLSWSAAEKKAARRAFEQAYHKQCMAIAAKVKQMIVEAADDPTVIWRIHNYLSQERKTTDEVFDYRYSVLITVFGTLLRDGWLTEADLAGLQADKIDKIKHWGSL